MCSPSQSIRHRPWGVLPVHHPFLASIVVSADIYLICDSLCALRPARRDAFSLTDFILAFHHISLARHHKCIYSQHLLSNTSNTCGT